MRITNSQKFLFINLDAFESDYETTLFVLDDFDQVLTNWGANSRVSPVWRVDDTALSNGGVDLYPTGSVFFASMINPTEVEVSLFSRIQEEIPSLKLLSTLGVCNLIFSLSSEDEAVVVRKFLDAGDFAFEEWTLEDNVAVSMKVCRKEEKDGNIDFDLKALKSDDRKLQSKHLELATNILAAARRGQMYFQWVESDLNKILKSYCESLQAIESCKKVDQGHYLDIAYYRIINANSAISRLTSQSLTGVQPLASSEGHYWPHSALGIGIASNAVRNVAAFFAARVGEFDFVQRIVNFEGQEYPFNKRPIDLSIDEMDIDFLTREPKTKTKKIVPVCFFSGRDSFKHDVYSLSLPLETIEAATSHQWSLRTVTHELTHRLIEPILGLLLPDGQNGLLDGDGNSKAYMNYTPCCLIDAAKVGILDALMAYARSQNSDFVDIVHRDISRYEELYDFIIQYSDFVEEFMVHTFDYLYFYSRDPSEYVQSLWLSWGIIPHLEDKLDDYVARTIVALSSNTLHLKDSIEEARKVFVKNFEKEYIEANCPHYQTVLDRVKSDEYWAENIKDKVVAGSVAGRFVVTFLYSDLANTHLYRDAALEAGDGYKISKGVFSTAKYTNPLRLMQEFSVYQKGVAAESAWLFHLLTFNVGEFE